MYEKEELFPQVNIYTDGGAKPNPGKGGFGVIMTYKKNRKEFNQGYRLTTNNRMELMSVIFGLEKLKKSSIVSIYSDSKYVVDAISKGWAEKWKSNNWIRTKNTKAINIDLWEKLLNLISKQKSVNFYWVKGHNGHPENERCDQLAEMALNEKDLLEDLGYFADDNTEDSYNINKVLKEGDLCNKCNTPVIKKNPKRKKIKANQKYYFEYYLLCTNCKTMYMVEEAKRNCCDTNNELFI